MIRLLRTSITGGSFTTCLSSRGKLTTLFIVSNAPKNRSEFVLIILYLQLINSDHADNPMADKKHGMLSF